MTNDEHAPLKVVRTVPCAERALTDSDPRTEDCADHNAAADLLEAALFDSEEFIDQATVDLSVELPLIEGYKLLRLLGEGGFGMVYEADQRVPIKRRVALKVLRPGCTTRELLARFEQERQMLAVLNHPHIARIFDAGETEDGRPFIAMELVKGSTIDRHCQKLALRDKISLMRDVCRAVAHAHHKGIIHRDLKPSNILITRPDEGPPEPRVIDFGIAKALDGPMVTKVMFTQMRQVVGTPGYMSPERQHTSQISHSADTRTDVFALGAILWELLTGKTPEQRPQGTDTHIKLPTTKGVPAELRWITEKATESDMERRYANADSLADDLDAWLDGLPLKAAPKSTLYVFSKWAARNRVAVLAVLAMLLTLISALVIVAQTNRQLNTALIEEENSQTGLRRALSHADYLMGITRERRRPVQAMAHWARAVKSDPHNRAAVGMVLSTLRHRRCPLPVAPSVELPEGELRQFALSADGLWAAMIFAQGEGEVLVRARRGEQKASEQTIPADGRMTMLAVSNEGRVAVAAARGPVGLLQTDGTWSVSERELEGLRGIVWTSQEQLWMIAVLEVSRCDAMGREAGDPIRLPGREWRWDASENGDFLAVGVADGGILVIDSNGLRQQFRAPIPAPFAALAVDELGERVATAWRSGEVWVRSSNGTTSTMRVADVLHVNFMADPAWLYVRGPSAVSTFNLSTGMPGRVFSLSTVLKQAQPVGDFAVLMHPTYGKPVIQGLHPGDDAVELPGFDGRVSCAVAGHGRVLSVVDEERRMLEWLSLGAALNTPAVLKDTPRWLAVMRSAEPHVWLAVDSNGTVSALTSQGEAETRWQGIAGPLRLAAVSADGGTLLVDIARTKSVNLIRQGREPQMQDWGKPSALTLSADGCHAVLGYPAGDASVRDTKTGAEVARHDLQRGPVTAVAFVAGGRIALAASSQVRVWDWRSQATLPTPIDLPGTISALAADRTGHRLAVASDDALYVIEVETGLRMACQLKGRAQTDALAWETDDSRLWAFAETGAMGIALPPFIYESPVWLPEWIEQHIGMKVDEQGRVVRVRTRAHHSPSVPMEAGLKDWLEQ